MTAQGPVGVTELLEIYTEQFRRKVALAGWYLPRSMKPNHRLPSEWDINNGWCDKWAAGAVALLRAGTVVWLDDGGGWVVPETDETFDHAVLHLDGKYYDAQCLEGVADYMDLPLCRGVTRDQWLRSKQKNPKRDKRREVMEWGCTQG